MKPLESDLLKTLCQLGTIHQFPKGHIFFNGYEDFDYIYCLTEGLCALMSLKDSGKEHVYYYLRPGALIGFTPALLEYSHEENIDSEAYFLIEAKQTCTAFQIEKTKVFELMQTHPDITKWIIGSLADISRNLLKHFYTAHESNAASKIAFTILSLAEEKGEELILQKEFNYLEISKYLGVHHITVARIIGSFKTEGLIEKTGHSTKIIDPAGIMEYAQNKRTLQY